MSLFIDILDGGPAIKRGDLVQSNVGDRRERTWIVLRAVRMKRRESGAVPRYRVWNARWRRSTYGGHTKEEGGIVSDNKQDAMKWNRPTKEMRIEMNKFEHWRDAWLKNGGSRLITKQASAYAAHVAAAKDAKLDEKQREVEHWKSEAEAFHISDAGTQQDYLEGRNEDGSLPGMKS